MKTNQTVRAKVRCLRILSNALTPVPVVVATLHKTEYVYLTYEQRHAIWCELLSPLQWSTERNGCAGGWHTLRGHAIDAESGAYHETPPAAWLNAEGSWVEVHPETEGYATLALDALRLWRKKHPKAEGQIHAPNWNTLTACRILALAARREDPGAEVERG